MKLTAVSGKVIWSSNSVVTLTSGSISAAPVSGQVSGGHGFVSGGGASGSISTTVKNLEKARIALFEGSERNVEFNCDSLFSPGNIATIVSRNGFHLAYYNQTTDRWFHHKLRLPFLQALAVIGMWVLAAYLGFKAISRAVIIRKYVGAEFSLDFYTLLWAVLAGAVAAYAIRFTRIKRKVVEAAVIGLVREHDKKYDKEINQSQEAWRKLVAEL